MCSQGTEAGGYHLCALPWFATAFWHLPKKGRSEALIFVTVTQGNTSRFSGLWATGLTIVVLKDFKILKSYCLRVWISISLKIGAD